MRILMPLLITTILITMLQGCAGVIVGGTAAGVTAVHDRRSTGTLVEDQEIELRFFNFKQQNPDFFENSDISSTSYNRRVLLSGSAASRAAMDRAIQFIRNLPGVRLVINEIELTPEGSIKDTLNDSYINTQVKLALFKIKMPDFDPTRVKVTTYNRSVYLMGLVSSSEGLAAADKARYIKGVKRVVKHFEYITTSQRATRAPQRQSSGTSTYAVRPKPTEPANPFLN